MFKPFFVNRLQKAKQTNEKGNNTMNVLKPKSEHAEHLLKQEILVFACSITANATPALKMHASDVQTVAVLKTQGKTSEADAIETYTSSPALADATGIFEVLIDDCVEKIYEARVVSVSTGTATIAAIKSAGERIILKLDSNQDLSAQSIDLVLEVKYKAKKR